MAPPRLALLLLLAAPSSAAVSTSCEGALTSATNATGLGRCVAACISAAAARGLPDGAQWEPSALGGSCATCAGELTQCKAQADASTGDYGWLGDSAAPEAEMFTCSVEYSWVNTTLNGGPAGTPNALTLRLPEQVHAAIPTTTRIPWSSLRRFVWS